ncbi:ABC transporter permease [Paracoccus lutimaris]|uniref:Peptide/nickel transport system permease protein n=1 Tax=Paracoccus lutimaris TaxID=1490030 RepID=A0A368Z2W0_9RHOB|nr:ABC transporter permease [Paracoccus lutimaris]RCW86793.1 peptide/nickel transport system permease protein [Paracoccus lutimaris]
MTRIPDPAPIASPSPPRVEVIAREAPRGSAAARILAIARYLRRNPQLVLGVLLLGGLLAFSLIGRLFIEAGMAQPLVGPASLPPGAEHPLGTDPQGRDILAVMVYGSWLTLRMGFLAGLIGMAAGSALGFVAGYYGGWTDRIITWLVDVLLTVPAILFLVIISAMLSTALTSFGMAMIIALLAWRRPARQVRSQILVMRNAGYVEMARLSGASVPSIIFREIAPNLMPFLISSFIIAVAAAILAGIGLEAMGLGPQNEPTLGMTIYWIMKFSAFLLGMWWILPPVLLLIILFVALYLINAGLDELANPRLRKRG